MRFHEHHNQLPYTEWVASVRRINGVQPVVGEGQPVTPGLNHGTWYWQCMCLSAQAIPQEGPVACHNCNYAVWREVDRSMIESVSLELHDNLESHQNWSPTDA